MEHPPGYTWREVISACAVIGLVSFFVILAFQPAIHLKKERDLVRETDVRHIMEAMLQLKTEDPTTFARLTVDTSQGQRMLGVGEACTGSFGRPCDDVILDDVCLEADAYHLDSFLSIFPVDPLRAFSTDATGYYVFTENDVMEVGACAPEARESITLQAHLGNYDREAAF